MNLSKFGTLAASLSMAFLMTSGIVSAAGPTPVSLSDAQSRADQRITARINLLNKIQTRIQSDKALSSDQQNALIGQLQPAITGLTQLKSQVDSATTAASVAQDLKQMVSSYRVYEVLAPQVHEMAAIESLQSTAAKITGKGAEIQSAINTVQSQGKDVTQLQASYNDMATRLQTINSHLATDQSEVSGITLTTTDPKPTFVQVQSDLKSQRSNLQAIRTDLQSLEQAFRSDSTASGATPVPTASPTP